MTLKKPALAGPIMLNGYIPHATDDVAPLTIDANVAHRAEAHSRLVGGAGSSEQQAGNAAQVRSPEEERTAAWAHMLQNPTAYLEAVLREYDDNSQTGTRQIAEILIVNNSRFSVKNVGGDVIWYDKSRGPIATVGFATVGILQANQQAVFSLAQRTLTSTPIARQLLISVLRCLRFEPV